MPKREILTKHKTTLTPIDKIDKDIFNYLRNNIKNAPITQTQIAKATNISQSTISRRLKEMIKKKYDYGSYFYRIVYENQGYKILKEPTRVSPIRKDYNFAEKREEFYEKRQLIIEELANNNVFLDFQANVITKTVIFYKIRKTKFSLVEKILISLYTPEKIYDIVPCKEGMYIILIENIRLEETHKDICKLYQEVIERCNLDKNPAKVDVKKKSKK